MLANETVEQFIDRFMPCVAVLWDRVHADALLLDFFFGNAFPGNTFHNFQTAVAFLPDEKSTTLIS